MSTEQRPLRADAERNRRAIICAASSVFAEHGSAVTLERIAEAAGVGVGTIYRRFPSIQDLIAVVMEEKMSRYADRTELAAERARTHPWEAFRDYVFFLLEEQASDLGFSDIILSLERGTEPFRAQKNRAFRASVQLINRAQRAGAIRPDFDHSDLLVLQHANAGLLRGLQPATPQVWKRFGQYLLQAYRHRGDEPLVPAAKHWHEIPVAHRDPPADDQPGGR